MFRAYHSSKADFDKFKLGAVKTGTGQRREGHGVYVAESPNVAQWYRDLLGDQGANITYGGKTPDEIEASGDVGLANVLRDMINMSNDHQVLHQMTKGQLDSFLQEQIRQRSIMLSQKKLVDALKKVDVNKLEITPGPVKTYELDINANPEDFINLNTGWEGQTPQVKDFLNRFITDNFPKPGEEGLRGIDAETVRRRLQEWPHFGHPNGTIYDNLASYLSRTRNGSNRVAHGAMNRALSTALRSQGIPGNRWLDADSRTEGHGTSNYTVFDPKIINILKKYGFAGAGLGAALAAGGQPDQAQATEEPLPVNRLTYHTGRTF